MRRPLLVIITYSDRRFVYFCFFNTLLYSVTFVFVLHSLLLLSSLLFSSGTALKCHRPRRRFSVDWHSVITVFLLFT